jgi:Leucine-rich repeat (LRR) protein
MSIDPKISQLSAGGGREMARRFISYFIAFVGFLALQTGSLFAQPTKHANTVDYETIAAYEILGATYVGWVKDDLVPVSIGGDTGFPGFYFRFATNRFAISKLPQVSVPFVMCLSVSADDLRKGLKELAGLKNLVGLSLEGRGVSDAVLKEVLDALPRLSSLGLYGTSVTEAGIKDLSTRKNVTSLSFHPREITDDFLRMLSDERLLHRLSRAEGRDGERPSSLDDIVSLNLGYTKVTNGGLRQLPNMRNLVKFTGKLTDDDLNGLRCLKNITSLDVSGTTFSDLSLEQIAGFTKLQALDVSRTKVTDSGLKSLRQMPDLSRLNLEKTRITDKGLKEIAGLKNLTVLNVGLTTISDAGLQELRACTKITELTIYRTKVTDAGLKNLVPLKALAKLDVSDITDAGLENLSFLNNLRELSLPSSYGSSSVSDTGLKHLAIHKNLTMLDLRNTNVTPEGLRELAGFKELQELRLSTVTDRHLRELHRLGLLHLLSFAKSKDKARARSAQDIAYLEFQGTNVTDAGLEEIAGLTSIIHLDLSNRNVTDKGLRQLAGMKQLSSLNLARTKVTDAGLKELVGLQNLRRLNLYSTPVTKAGKADLLKTMPRCAIVEY